MPLLSITLHPTPDHHLFQSRSMYGCKEASGGGGKRGDMWLQEGERWRKGVVGPSDGVGEVSGGGEASGRPDQQKDG